MTVDTVISVTDRSPAPGIPAAEPDVPTVPPAAGIPAAATAAALPSPPPAPATSTTRSRNGRPSSAPSAGDVDGQALIPGSPLRRCA